MSIVVSSAAPDEVADACRLAFVRDPDRAGRCRDLLANGEFDPAGLVVARRGERLCGAVLVQALTGALGMAWPPVGDDAIVEDALTRAGVEYLRGRGVKVCQAFTTPGELATAAPLERTGFRHVTQVTFLSREIDPRRDAGRGDRLGLRLRGFWGIETAAFTDVLWATYDGSLDCPELNGSRTPAEITDGFRVPNTHPRDYWFVAEHDGRPAGVVMLDPGPPLEVSYLGLVPAARGRGLGDELVRFAAARAASDGATELHLSVDARNDPAQRLYRRHGFRPFDYRDVFLADLD